MYVQYIANIYSDILDNYHPKMSYSLNILLVHSSQTSLLALASPSFHISYPPRLLRDATTNVSPVTRFRKSLKSVVCPIPSLSLGVIVFS